MTCPNNRHPQAAARPDRTEPVRRPEPAARGERRDRPPTGCGGPPSARGSVHPPLDPMSFQLAGMRAGPAPCDAGPMLRCLIIDDSPRFLDAARALLERQGIAVVGVASNST